MQAGIKHPDDLQDKDILVNMDAHRGTGVRFGEFESARKGATPIDFIARVKGEYRAWYNGQEVEERRKARVSETSHREATQDASPAAPALQQIVQSVETSLEATIKAQVSALTEKRTRAKSDLRKLEASTIAIACELMVLEKELRLAEKFLGELSGDKNEQQIPSSVGGDIPKEVGQRKPRGRNRVAKANDPEIGDSGSKEGNQEDTGGTNIIDTA